MRWTQAPSATSLAAIHAELVSTVRPVRSSRPTATISVSVPDSDDIRRWATALARDRTAGATALACRAARLLRAAARDDGKTLARWQQRVRAAGAAMAAAQPAMASLLTVVDLTFRAAERARSPAAGASAVRAALDGYLASQGEAVRAAAARLVPLLPPRASCLTLTSSAVASRAFLLAHRQGRLGRLVVAESRPGCEGVELAARLAAAGVPVAVIVDALGPARAATVDAVVVGADAVTPRTVWNKCGTLGLALGAR
ncbi:MAG: translation initiation factor eIF-2B, partial [Deltaproteobacteria bacterium]